MKRKTGLGRNSAEAKYTQLIQDYLKRIDTVRQEMRQSKAEIERLKNASRRKLAEIDAVLEAC